MTRLIATDLDGTMVGDADGLGRLLPLLASRRGAWRLAYVTGRTLPMARRLAEEEGLPEPDVWVTEVGARITASDGRPDAGWAARMAADWRREVVAATAGAFAALSPQPPEAQSDLKVSYHLQPHIAPHVLSALQRALAAAGAPALLVYSSARDLDIVPAAAGKGGAVQHLMSRFGVPLDRLLTCGDSANDRDMLCLGGAAVAVGNAHGELFDPPLPHTVYRANDPSAAGILEALHYFRWLEEGA
jgi:sucrose-phosphate synthase